MTTAHLARIRERLATPLLTTLALSVLAVGCGGNSPRDTYAHGTEVQEQCCEHLQGPARDACLQQIVRVGDPEVARTAVNQQQYACVVDNFVCDPAQGHATQASAQAQLDCIQALE